ncbi:MAG TPA: glycosyltransferase family 2 protein [Caulobacteraceae bacterium]|nr:glycosyltransferase family 2 protein [Caulobacteraceae bacterium]
MSAVVPCKGRLAHLKITLPLLMALPLREVVVVDYDCPEGTGDWVQTTFPAARLVRVANQPGFSISVARNLGARVTTAPWIFFVDADTKVFPGLWDEIAPRLAPGAFFVAEPRLFDLWGTFVTARTDFDALGGFDEIFQGWGGEDADFLERLVILGRRPLRFDARLAEAIQHSDELRMRHHQNRDRQLSGLVNDTYRMIKNDLARQGAPLDEAMRLRLYGEVRESMADGARATTYEVRFRDYPMHDHVLTATLKYQLRPQDGAAPADPPAR